MNRTFLWERNGKDLRAVRLAHPIDDNDMFEFITEKDMDAVADWCTTAGIGRRMSFDIFRFKRREDITAFLLRWS